MQRPAGTSRSVPRSRRRSVRLRAGWSVALVLVVIAATAACGDDDVSDGNQDDTTTTTSTTAAPGGATNGTAGLARTSWKLTGAVDGTVPTLDFAQDGTFSGSTGCNRITGTWIEEGDSVTLEAGPMTQMACTSDEANEQEKEIVAALGKVAAVDQTPTTLRLLDGDEGELLVYEAVTGDLQGTSWKVTGVNTGTALESSALTEALTIDFGTEGSVTGRGGCNNFTGTYTLDGGTITFSEFASTMMGCDEAVMEMEDKYLAALAAASTVERSGDSLTLRDGDGAMQVTATLAN